MRLTLRSGPAAPAPLLYYASVLQLSDPSRIRSAGALEDERFEERVAVELEEGDTRRTFLLSLDEGGLVRVEAEGGRVAGRVEPCGLLLPELQRARSTEVVHLLFEGGTAGRRLRMTARTIEELRRRQFPLVASSIGALPDEAVHLAPPDELFVALDGEDYGRLLHRSHLVLEASDGIESPTPLARIALSLGLPVVAHASFPLPASHRADGWSWDSFADAVVAACGRRPDAAGPVVTDPVAPLLEALDG